MRREDLEARALDHLTARDAMTYPDRPTLEDPCGACGHTLRRHTSQPEGLCPDCDCGGWEPAHTEWVPFPAPAAPTSPPPSRPTCGPLYRDALESYAGGDPDQVRLFAAGFVTGQAEKTYLGACRAAMFRPSAERAAMLLGLAFETARRYGLYLACMGGEVWLCRDRAARDEVGALAGLPRDSPAWHAARAALCGVPAAEVDPAFHGRPGAGQRCD